MAKFTKEAGAALAFGILYATMLVYMLTMYATKRYQWKSRWSILLFHTTIRVASQACGVAFGILAFSNVDVFVAYLILGAEGYFSLTLAAYYFLKSFHHKHFHKSFLGPTEYRNAERRKRIFESLSLLPLFTPWRYYRHELLVIIDACLVPANAIIIAGGSFLAGLYDPSKNLSQSEIDHRLNVAKGLRTAGQSIFFACTVCYAVCLVITAKKFRRHDSVIPATLFLFGVVAFFLHIRGIFGVLQSAIYSLSYLNTDNYNESGFTDKFTALEYCLGVLPEFCAAALLNASYWTNRKEEPAVPDGKEGLSDQAAVRGAGDVKNAI